MNTSKYEAVYILPGAYTDEEIQKVVDHFKEVVEKNGGTVESAEKWTKRRLAYEIDGHRDGNYCLMVFEAPAEVPAELRRLMDISDDIVRRRIYKLDPRVEKKAEAAEEETAS